MLFPDVKSIKQTIMFLIINSNYLNLINKLIDFQRQSKIKEKKFDIIKYHQININ